MRSFIKIFILIIFLQVFLFPVFVFSGDFSFVTVNAWSGVDYKGFFSCGEYENENDRSFRREVLFSGLEDLDADIIILNGVNPAQQFSDEAALYLGLNFNTAVSRSGLRIGPVSIPANLREGDVILCNTDLVSEPAGRLHMEGLFSNSAVTVFSRNGIQILGSRITSGDLSFYVFSAVWTESLFSDAESLKLMTDGYLSGSIAPDDYREMINNAVTGSQLRLEQAARTLSFINSIAGESQIVLLGSLNALPDSAEINLLKDAGFIDVFQKAGRGDGYTVDVKGNSNFKKVSGNSGFLIGRGQYRADYIMIRGEGMVPVSAGVVLDSPVYGVYPSNRYGVKAVIRLSPTSPSGQ